MICRNQMASVIALAIAFCRSLLAVRWHIRVEKKPATAFKASGIVLCVIPEFNGTAPTAIKPEAKAFIIKFK